MKHDLNIIPKSSRRKHKKTPCDVESKVFLDLDPKEINYI